MVLRLLLDVLHPQGARDFCVTAAAVAANATPWLREFDPSTFADVGGQPTPAFCKAVLLEVAVLLGLDPRGDAPGVRASPAVLLDFLARHVAAPRRRFNGHTRRYIELGMRGAALGAGPPALTLSVPPSAPSAWPEWWSRQATSGDDQCGVQLRGLRVNLAALLSHPAVPAKLKDRLLHGHECIWTEAPPRRRLDNYRSCLDNAELSGADFDRIHAEGFTEGPLEYLPWIVNPIGCIIKTEPRFKVRNAMDCTRSGVNPVCARLPCSLDDIDTVVRRMSRGLLGCKFDLADAFHCWPVAARSCDYFAFRHPVSGALYRYRYLPFGLSQAPSFQQDWARVVQAIVAEEGLQFCAPGCPEADPARFSAAGAYLDDFLNTFADMQPWEAAFGFWSILCTLQLYGLPVKHIKNEWPATSTEYVGLAMDIRDGLLWLPEARRLRYREEVRAVRAAGAGGTVSRRALAAVVGRLQWAVWVVPEGQARLTECYRTRDDLDPALGAPSGRDAWLPDALCQLSAAACQELDWWLGRLLGPCSRPFYHDGFPGGLLWGRGALGGLPSDEELDRLARQGPDAFYDAHPFCVVTTDASGWAGGAWMWHHSLHYAFTEEQLQGLYGGSSNLRELYMVPVTVEQWGVVFHAYLPGRRLVLVLFRLDNQAAVGAVNRGSSMVPHVNQLILWLHDLEARLGVKVLARYLPGKLNTRADGISRLRGAVDDQDWQLRGVLFAQLDAEWGPFDVDACCDVLGHNAHCPVFWSELNSCLEHCWAGKRVYCNPPFRAAEDILRHFHACWQRAPGASSAVFILPVWPSERWWRLLSGGRVVAYWPPGSSVFTSPDWRLASKRVPLPQQRADRGVTRWPAVAVLFPQAAVSPFGPPSPAQVVSHLPALSGDPGRDRLLLRRLSPGVVPRVRQAARGRPGAVQVPGLRSPPPWPPDGGGQGGVAAAGRRRGV